MHSLRARFWDVGASGELWLNRLMCGVGRKWPAALGLDTYSGIVFLRLRSGVCVLFLFLFGGVFEGIT